MSNKVANIIIVETSEIIFEGISSILSNTGHTYNIKQANNLGELEQLNLRTRADIVIINPQLIQNQTKEFQTIKKELTGTHWIGIVYSIIDPLILSALDEIVNINDKTEKIIALVQKLLISPDQSDDQLHQETLSERETDVLKLLVAGNANKEIADKLNISTHTVISHRKNISQKTGIKSVSGLTIYAVVKNIITIDSYKE
jgi:DNA-binding NarL/FixJ family response regulator